MAALRTSVSSERQIAPLNDVPACGTAFENTNVSRMLTSLLLKSSDGAM